MTTTRAYCAAKDLERYAPTRDALFEVLCEKLERLYELEEAIEDVSNALDEAPIEDCAEAIQDMRTAGEDAERERDEARGEKDDIVEALVHVAYDLSRGEIGNATSNIVDLIESYKKVIPPITRGVLDALKKSAASDLPAIQIEPYLTEAATSAERYRALAAKSEASIVAKPVKKTAKRRTKS